MAVASFCLFSLGLLFTSLYLTSDGPEGVGADYTGIIPHPERTFLDPGNLWIPKLPLNAAVFPAVTFNSRTGCRFNDAMSYIWCLKVMKADMFFSNNAKYMYSPYTPLSQCRRFDILTCFYVNVMKLHIDPNEIIRTTHLYLEPSTIPYHPQAADVRLISGTANSTKLLFIRLACRLTLTNVTAYDSPKMAWDPILFLPVVNRGIHQKVAQT